MCFMSYCRCLPVHLSIYLSIYLYPIVILLFNCRAQTVRDQTVIKVLTYVIIWIVFHWAFINFLCISRGSVLIFFFFFRWELIGFFKHWTFCRPSLFPSSPNCLFVCFFSFLFFSFFLFFQIDDLWPEAIEEVGYSILNIWCIK